MSFFVDRRASDTSISRVSLTILNTRSRQLPPKNSSGRQRHCRLTEGYSTVEIGVDPYVVLLPSDALPLEQPLTWAFVRQHRIIMLSPSDRGYDELRSYTAGLDIPLDVAYEVNEDAVIVSMVAQRLGLAILPYFAALPIPESVQVRQLPDLPSRQLAAIIREDSLHPPAVFLFLNLIEQIGQSIFRSNEFPTD